MVAKKNQPACAQYEPYLYEKYVNDKMSLEEMSAFVEHSENCSICRSGFSNYIDSRENRLLMDRAEKLLDRFIGKEVETYERESIFEIVVGKVKKVLQVLSSTGEIMTPSLCPALVRGIENTVNDDNKIIQVHKDFKNPPMSVELSFKEVVKSQDLETTLSLFDKISDDFIADCNVLITGPGIKQNFSSDKDGEVKFTLCRTGVFQVIVSPFEGQEVEINIGIEK